MLVTNIEIKIYEKHETKFLKHKGLFVHQILKQLCLRNRHSVVIDHLINFQMKFIKDFKRMVLQSLEFLEWLIGD